MYRSIDARFWTDPKVRALTPNVRYLLLYLITNPHGHVSGLYYLPLPTISHETGLPEKEIRRGIDTLSKGSLCLFDTSHDLIWVVNMLRYQGHGEKIGRAVQAQLHSLHNSALLKEFASHYGYSLDTLSDTLSKGDQHQEQETKSGNSNRKLNQETNLSCEGGPPLAPKGGKAKKPKKPKSEEKSPHSLTWEAYRDAYVQAYGVSPVSNAMVQGQVATFLKRVGVGVAPALAAFYVQHKDQFYVLKRHPFGLLLQDAESIHTQWKSKQSITHAQAKQIDKTAALVNTFTEAHQELYGNGNGGIHEHESLGDASHSLRVDGNGTIEANGKTLDA